MIQSFPIQFAGVGGSVAQITFQIGGVIGVAVQSGLDSTGTGLADWKGTQAGFWFGGAVVLAAGISFGKSLAVDAATTFPSLSFFISFYSKGSSTGTKLRDLNWSWTVRLTIGNWLPKSWAFRPPRRSQDRSRKSLRICISSVDSAPLISQLK